MSNKKRIIEVSDNNWHIIQVVNGEEVVLGQYKSQEEALIGLMGEVPESKQDVQYTSILEGLKRKVSDAGDKELEEIREAYRKRYELLDLTTDIFFPYYDESSEMWEIVFNNDCVATADSKEEAQRLTLLCQLVYTEALTEGITLGINNPEVAAELVRRLEGSVTLSDDEIDEMNYYIENEL